MSEEAPDFDEVMRMARRWHYDEVRSIADAAIQELNTNKELKTAREKRGFLDEWVNQTTDDHQHVIYTAQASMILAASDHEDEWQEFGGDAMPDTSARACLALRADVWDQINARSDEWEHYDEEGDEQ